jgi:hypothetical protein
MRTKKSGQQRSSSIRSLNRTSAINTLEALLCKSFSLNITRRTLICAPPSKSNRKRREKLAKGDEPRSFHLPLGSA